MTKVYDAAADVTLRGAAWLGSVAGEVGRRLRPVLWPVVQTSVAAALAWYIAHTLLGSPQPFFAPVAAAVSLSASSLLRGQRALQLIGGVVLGIAVGSVFGRLAGTSAVALGGAVLVSLVLAVAMGQGFLAQGLMFFNQSAAAAVLVMTLHRGGTAPQRLVDALIGGGVAFVISVIFFPTAPGPIIERATRGALLAIRDTVGQVTELLAHGAAGGTRQMLPARRRIHQQLAQLDQALASAQEVVRIAPRRWRDRPAVSRAAERAGRLDLLADSVLGLLLVTSAAIRAGHQLPAQLGPSVRQLITALEILAGDRVARLDLTAPAIVVHPAGPAESPGAAGPARAARIARETLASLPAVPATGQRRPDLVVSFAATCLRDLLAVIDPAREEPD